MGGVKMQTIYENENIKVETSGWITVWEKGGRR
jgi:hypothetical protein